MEAGMFGRKKKEVKIDFDKNRQKPVIHSSICTGEQVAGLKDLETGKFEEIMVIRSADDLRRFQEMTGVTNIEKEY